MRTKTPLRHFRWRVGRRVCGLLIALMAAAFFFSDQLLSWGVQHALDTLFPQVTTSFQGVQLRKKGITLTQFKSVAPCGEVSAPHIDVKWKGIGKHFLVFPKIEVTLPQIVLTGDLKEIALLFSSAKRCKPSITIDQGTVQWKGNRYPFSLKSYCGEEGEIRSTSPRFFCGWKKSELGYDIDLNLEEAPLALFSTVVQREGVEITEGSVTFSGKGTLTPLFEFRSLQGKGRLHSPKGSDRNSGCTFSAQSLTFEIDAPQQLSESTVSALFEEGHLVFDNPFQRGAWDVVHLNGEIKRSAHDPFSAQFQGDLVREGGGFAWKATAQGDSLKEWKADVAFEDQEEVEFHLSRREGATHVAFKECDDFFIDLGQEVLSKWHPQLSKWEVTEGVVSGELECQASGERRFRNLIGRDFKVQNVNRRAFISLKKFKAHGSVNSSGEIAQLSALFQDLDADLIRDDGDIWNLSNLGGTFSMKEGKIVESKVQGSFLGFTGELTVEGPALWSETKFRLEGSIDQAASLFSQEVAEAYHESEELPVKITGIVQTQGEISHVMIDLFVSEKMQTPLHLKAAVKHGAIEEATFTSKSLPHAVYAPLAASIFSSLELGGDWEVAGEYAKGSLTCSLKTKSALIGHAAYPLTMISEKGVVQATLTGNVHEDRWRLALPRFKGKLKGSKPFDFAFEATLDIVKEGKMGWHMQAQFDQGRAQLADRFHLQALTFDARFDEKDQTLVCHQIKGTVASLPSRALFVDTLQFKKLKEKWAWGTFTLSEKERPSSKGRIELLSNGRNPQSFLIYFQNEQESPRFFQWKNQSDVWTLEPLPQEIKKPL